MSTISPDIHQALLCIFSQLEFVEDAKDVDEGRVYLEQILEARNARDRRAITRVMRRLLADPDADLSEFSSPHQLRDGGAELRRRMAMVAPIFDIHPHVRERDLSALQAWLDEERPTSELREYVLGELSQLSPEQRADVVRVAFKDYRGITAGDAYAMGEAVKMLAKGELSAERFDRGILYLVRNLE